MAIETDVGNLTYELLKKVRAEQQEMRFELLDTKSRLTDVEQSVASISVWIAQVEVSMAGVNKRLDHFGEGFDRIERRLELRQMDNK